MFRLLSCDAQYGTSISEGATASRGDLGWNVLTVRALGYDLLNLGSSSTAYCEPAIADSMAELKKDLCVLDISVNMSGSGFTIEQFKERADYVFGVLATSRPEMPIRRPAPSRCFGVLRKPAGADADY